MHRITKWEALDTSDMHKRLSIKHQSQFISNITGRENLQLLLHQMKLTSNVKTICIFYHTNCSIQMWLKVYITPLNLGIWTFTKEENQISFDHKRNVCKNPAFSIQGIKLLPEIGFKNRIKENDMLKFQLQGKERDY